MLESNVVATLLIVMPLFSLKDVKDKGSMNEDSNEEASGNGAVIQKKNPKGKKQPLSKQKDSLKKNENAEDSLSEKEDKESGSGNDRLVYL